jgi:hypothetical protein
MIESSIGATRARIPRPSADGQWAGCRTAQRPARALCCWLRVSVESESPPQEGRPEQTREASPEDDLDTWNR